MRSFVKDKAGQITMLVGLLSPIGFGVAAFAVDLATVSLVDTRLHTAADAAALAAVAVLPDTTTARTRALEIAAQNAWASDGTVTSNADVQFGTYDTAAKVFSAGATPPNAVRVTAARTTAKGNPIIFAFARVFGVASQDRSISAVAMRFSPAYCFLVLDPKASGAFNVSGTGKLSVPNCGVQVNSTSDTAATVGNNATAQARSFCVVGGASGTSFNPKPVTKCAAAPDPLALLPEPAQPTQSCTYNGLNTGSGQTLPSNATYCGKITLNGNGNFSLQPGVYYFKNATVKLLQNASLVGSGVTLFLDETSTLEFGASGTVNLSAPSQGPYKGVLIFQARGASATTTSVVRGSPDIYMDGTIYMPSSTLSMTGSGSISDVARSGYVIVGRVNYSGSVTFNFDAYSNVLPVGFKYSSGLVN
ncbi:TadG family pilus assembly protein [Methylobacterium oxalidis]|uniref:TadG family pilus assembly protein n=1 Tax=Methylobacterium oxalidis TaxID=944322 RepID=UPI00331636A6